MTYQIKFIQVDFYMKVDSLKNNLYSTSYDQKSTERLFCFFVKKFNTSNQTLKIHQKLSKGHFDMKPNLKYSLYHDLQII